VDDAHTLDELATQFALISLEGAAAGVFPRRDVDATDAVRLTHGARLPAAGIDQLYAAFGPDGTFLALLEDDGNVAKPGACSRHPRTRDTSPGDRCGWSERGGCVQRWEGLEQVPEGWGPSVVTVGVFDGVHRGHQHTVGRAAHRGVELGLPVAAVTFDPNPVEVVRPGLHPLVLTAIDRREQLLGDAGADAVLVQQFTDELYKQAPEQFVVDFLVRGLHAAAVVVGRNFRYGHRAAGTPTMLDAG
jgi:hypothetical protein